MSRALIIFKSWLSKALHSRSFWKITRSPLTSMEHWAWAGAGWDMEGKGPQSAAWDISLLEKLFGRLRRICPQHLLFLLHVK